MNQLVKAGKMETKDLINWGESSGSSGSRQTVRKNKIPRIHWTFYR